MKLSIAVACHPSRFDYATRLARTLCADLVVDPDPTGPPLPWRTMRAAWLATPASVTHRLVVQDDAIPVPDAAALAAATIATAPDSPVALYAGLHHATVAHRVVEAEQLGEQFAVVRPGGWMPTVATVLPAEDAFDMVALADERGWSGFADDEILGRWLRERNRLFLVRVPSLFDHDDDAPSIANPRRTWYPRRAVRLAG